LLDLNRAYHGNCLELMKEIDGKSVDMILCDLPYGITKCKWDSVIPFESLWEQYERIIKDNGAIVLTASQPFTSALVMSNPKIFRYEWIWEKDQGVNFQNAKRQPLKVHESVLVFSKKPCLYHPQGTIKLDKPQVENNRRKIGKLGHITVKTETFERWVINYPRSIQRFNKQRGLHPTQKPVSLFEYLIRTYTDEGMLVLDNCAGSGTTGIAAINTKRDFILIEQDQEYFNLIENRLQHHLLHKNVHLGI
jgi:site-specific DNA-methyltransferase (adenine-specific)